MELHIKLGWVVGVTSIILILLWIVLKEIVRKVKQEEVLKREELQKESSDLKSEVSDLEAKIKYYTNLTDSGRVYQYELFKVIINNLPEPRAAIEDYDVRSKFVLFRFSLKNPWDYDQITLGEHSVTITSELEYSGILRRYSVGGQSLFSVIVQKGDVPIMTIPITKTEGGIQTYIYNFPKFMILGNNDYMVQEAMKVGFNSIFPNE